MTNIAIEQRGHILLMGINRPEKRNSFTTEMLNDLAMAYTKLEDTPELRCGVLYAVGEMFTAGLDLAAVAPVIEKKGALAYPENAIDPFGVHTSRERTKPVVAAVHGKCLTLGIELLLACDIRIAADNASFAQIEVKRGIFPFGGATLRLPEVAGWGNAMRWLLTGDEFDAIEAMRIGLVQKVTKNGKHIKKAIAIAETIAAQAPLGVQATVRSARNCQSNGFQIAAKELMPQALELFKTRDAQEGVASFIERREAQFEGR